MIKRAVPVLIDGISYVVEAHHVEETTVMMEYIKILEEELNETVPIACAHGWVSKRGAQGVALRRSLGYRKPELPTCSPEQPG
jgi:hypothetical protein